MPMFARQPDVPRLPLPPLDATLRRFVDACAPLLDDDERQRTRALVARFAAGHGAVLDRRLRELDAQRADSSYVAAAWSDMYLRGRWPLPLNVNPVLLMTNNPANGGVSSSSSSSPAPPPATIDAQLDRAVALLGATLDFVVAVRRGTLTPDVGAGGAPIDMTQHLWQFGSARVPRAGIDELTTFAADDAAHIAVLLDGDVHMVRVFVDGAPTQPVGVDELARQLRPLFVRAFDARTRASNTAAAARGADVQLYTSDERDAAARVRAHLERTSATNRASLAAVDRALLCVSLLPAERCAATASRIDRAYTALTTHDVWYDKNSLVFFADGSVGANFEHSWGDGHTYNRWLQDAWQRANTIEAGWRAHGHSPAAAAAAATTTTTTAPSPLAFDVDARAREMLDASRRRLDDAIAGSQLALCEHNAFGKHRIKTWRMSPDAVAQLAFHLAYTRAHGHTPGVYESGMTKHFLAGRTETVRPSTAESRAFAALASCAPTSGDVWQPSGEMRAALYAAADAHVGAVKRALGGEGVDRHLWSLQQLLGSDESAVADSPAQRRESAEFFADAGYTRLRHDHLSTSNLSMPCIDLFAFGATVGDGYGLGYGVEAECVRATVSHYANDARQVERFVELLHDSLERVRAIAESE